MPSLFKNNFTSFIFSNVTESSLPLAVAAHLHKLNIAQLGNSVFFARVALNSQISLKIYETVSFYKTMKMKINLAIFQL